MKKVRFNRGGDFLLKKIGWTRYMRRVTNYFVKKNRGLLHTNRLTSDKALKLLAP